MPASFFVSVNVRFRVRDHVSVRVRCGAHIHGHVRCRFWGRAGRGVIISTFSWGGTIFFFTSIQSHRTIEKLEKQHFICIVIWRYS